MNAYLLNSTQMAHFVDEGYIILEGVIPEHLCQQAIDETREKEAQDAYTSIRDQRHHYAWDQALGDSIYKDILELPQVSHAIESLVGPDPQFDHYRVHRTQPLTDNAHLNFLHYHQDCMVDMRPYTFDINVSIYPQEITEDMGGTMFLPGSQYRKVHNSNMYRYQHVRGSTQLVCPAGTVVLWHGNIWHSGRPNRSDSDRIMFLARFNPRVPQIRLWNTDDMDQEEVARIMLRGHAWIGGEHPLEWMNRIRQWRYMSGDHEFDFMGYAKRVHHSFEYDLNDLPYRESVYNSIPR